MEYQIKTSADTGVRNNLKNATECNKNDEQERTKIKKEYFLVVYRKLLGSVQATCDKVDIDRVTFYRWKESDPEFAKAIRECWKYKLEDVEQLLHKAMMDGDTSAIKYFLDRKHPGYMPKLKVVAPMAGEKSIEDIFIEGEWKDDNNFYEPTNEEETTTEQPISNTKLLQDKKQEGEISSVQIEQSPNVLLDEKDEKKSGS